MSTAVKAPDAFAIAQKARGADLLGPEENFKTITDSVSDVAEWPRPPIGWYIAFTIAATFLVILLAMIGYLISTGVGVWGNNNPVGWAFPIVNFVFWVGIGHAGTLISAVLLLFRQKWRTSINRFAEAMTIFAVICAAMFPGIHVGRIWFAYWLFPYPNQMQMWPNFRSPLAWDMFAVGTYATVSLLFWYVGMIPDLATFRDRAKGKIRHALYGIFAMGWRGSARQWHRYEIASIVLAGIATPLVLSVHSVVGTDFAVGIVPGWHTTIIPPYFVAGAIFSGLAMVVTLAVPARAYFGLKNIITMRHLEIINKLILVTSMLVGYAYSIEFFTAWYSGHATERYAFLNRAFGPMGWSFWTMVTCNVVIPQVFWFKKMRTSIAVMFVVSIFVNIGMWFERFVIVITSLYRDFLPSSWGAYSPTWVDALTLMGSFGLFSTLFLLFCRYLPMVAMFEVKGILPNAQVHHGADAGGHHE